MPTNTWDANGGTKSYNTDGNWSLGHVPQADEDVVIDGTGSATCDLDVDTASLLSFTMSAGALNMNGYTLTVKGNVSITGGTLSKGTGTVDITNSGNLVNSVAANELYILKCAASGYTTTLTGACNTERLEVGAGELALADYVMHVGQGETTGSVKILTVDASATISRTSASGEIYIYVSNSGTNTMDGFSASTINFSVFGSGSGTLQVVTRALTVNGVWYWQSGTWDMNDFALTCTGIEANTGTMLFGSASHDVNGDMSTYDNGGTLNLESCTINLSGNWNTGSNTVTPGTSTLVLDGSGQQITSNSQNFADVDVAASGEVDMMDAFSCAAFDLQSGTFDTNSYAMSCSSWTLTAGTFSPGTSTISISGNCKRLGGALVGTSGTWDLTGSGDLQNDFLTSPFGLVKCAATSQTTTLTETCMAKKWEFGTGVLTAAGGGYDFAVYQPSTGKLITNAGVTINASGGYNPNFRQWYGSGGAGFTYDAVNFGSGNVVIDPGTNTYVDLLGNWTTTGSFTYSAASNGSNFDLNGHNLTCGALVLSGSAGNSQTFYCGEGTVICTSFSTGSLAGVTTLNLESCDFYCSGDFTIGHANHAIVYGTSTVVLSGDSAQAVDLKGEQLYNLDITNVVGTVSFTTAMYVAGTFKPGNGASTVTVRFPTSGTTHWNAYDSSAATGTGTIDLNSIGESASWALTLGSNQTATSTDVSNSNLTGYTMNATAATNVDGGGNSANWVFEAVGEDVPQKMDTYRRRRVHT